MRPRRRQRGKLLNLLVRLLLSLLLRGLLRLSFWLLPAAQRRSGTQQKYCQ
jgi:hypothetical protein